MPANYHIVQACLAAMGAVFPTTFANPTAVLVGDSLTQYAHFPTPNASNLTFNRSGTGVITGAVPNSVLFGTSRCYPVNFTDTSFEVLSRNFYADAGAGTAGVSIHTSNTTPATTTSQSVTGGIINLERYSHRGVFTNFNALRGGGIELLGNFGHGGMLASAMGPQMTYALSFSPQIVFLMAGTNDAKSDATGNGNAIFGYVKTLIDQANTAGAFVVVQAVIPLGSANAGYAAKNLAVIGDPNDATHATSANYQLKQMCAGGSYTTKTIFVDAYNPVCDKTVPTAPQLYNNMTPDSTHINGSGPYLIANAMDTAVGSKITTTRVLSSSASDVGASAVTAKGHTRVKTAGPWTLTIGGTYTSGGASDPSPPGGYTSGLANGWVAGRGSGTTGLAASMFDPGDGLGIKQHFVLTPQVVNDTFTIYPFGASGITLAALQTALGSTVTATDNSEWEFGFELDWTGSQAAGLGLVQAYMPTNGSGLYGLATNGENVEAVVSGSGTLPDAITGRVLITGRVQFSNASITAIAPQIICKFGSITGVSCGLNIRAVTVLKF